MNVSTVVNGTKTTEVTCSFGSFNVSYYPHRLTSRFVEKFQEIESASDNVEFLIKGLISDWELTFSYPIVDQEGTLVAGDDGFMACVNNVVKLVSTDSVVRVTDGVFITQECKVPMFKRAYEEMPMEIINSITTVILSSINPDPQKSVQ